MGANDFKGSQMFIPGKAFYQYLIGYIHSRQDLSLADQKVYIELGRHLNKFIIRPAKFSQDINMSREQVIRSLRKLLELNYIKIVGKGTRRQYAYDLAGFMEEERNRYYFCSEMGKAFEYSCQGVLVSVKMSKKKVTESKKT